MIAKVYRSGTAWVMASTLLRMGGGIILFPLILRYLTKEEIGLWYVLGAAGGMAMLVDFGLSATTVRSVAALHAGAKKLLVDGHADGGGLPNWPVIASFYEGNKVLYRWLAVVIWFIFFAAVYFGLGHEVFVLNGKTMVSVFLFSIGAVFIVIDASQSAFLTGLGAVVKTNKIISFSNLVYVVFAGLGIVAGGGLMALSVTNLIQGVLRFLLTRREIRRVLSNTVISEDPSLHWRLLLKAIWPNTWRYGVMCVGAYLILSANTLLVSRSLGLAEVSSYGISNQAVALLASISCIFLNARLPEIIRLGVVGHIDERKKIFWTCHILGLITFVVGSLALVLMGREILLVIGSGTKLLMSSQLWLLVSYRLLEFNHSQFAVLVISGNKMPFLWPAIISGVAIMAFSYLTIGEYGLWGVLISTAIVQLAVNNWYPVILGLRKLNTA